MEGTWKDHFWRLGWKSYWERQGDVKVMRMCQKGKSHL